MSPWAPVVEPVAVVDPLLNNGYGAYGTGGYGRGLHSSTSQHNLSRLICEPCCGQFVTSYGPSIYDKLG